LKEEIPKKREQRREAQVDTEERPKTPNLVSEILRNFLLMKRGNRREKQFYN
jgi:hypothetical protein